MASREPFKQPATHCIDCGEMHPRRAELQPSPFHSLMVEEKMPNASETAAIRDFIVDIDAEMAWREEAIKRLRCEVVELRRRSDHHKAIIAPIRRLPPETMAEIFLQLTAMEKTLKATPKQINELTMTYSPDIHYMVRPVVHRAPLIFCEISRKWRAIALSIPRLWNSLSIRCKDKKTSTSTWLCEMWLKRSGSLPLTIRLYPRPYKFPSFDRPFEDSEDVVKTILPFAARWGSLDLDNLPASSLSPLCHTLSEPMPMLETLSVCHGWQSAITESAPWEGVRVDAPKLRRLYFDKIGGARIITQREQATFPWSQLTHIDLGDCSADDCLQILSQASAAVECRFDITWSFSPEAHHPSILLPELQTLQIHVHDNVSLGPWWNYLTCPALATLFVGSDPLPQSLPAFITRNGKTIEDFTLVNPGLDDDEFMAYLADMPLLRRLKVSDAGQGRLITNEFWESLTWATAGDLIPLIPKLESLDITGGVDCSHKYIVRMLKSRLRRAAPELKFVKLSFWRNLSSSVYSKLLAFGEFGLKMTVDHLEFLYDREVGSEASDTEDEAGGDSGELENP
ncbi:hypothetical protein MSAN_01271600 [Mycena sanguinolenta]|uniref:F-box domain-containing protein n=1 Tax=Mycena sanguinolenta TaxID=230812 RepID=A0A8H7D4Q0_9AGAR|nr:hypothetical protein MSAN_01271600 [Mycena sanguinolenta]